MKISNLIIIFVFCLFITMLTGCAQPTPSATPISSQSPVKTIEITTAEKTADPTIPPLNISEIPQPSRNLEDADASLKWREKRVLSGDNFLDNLFERPFTAKEMIYQPDINILDASIAMDDQFFFFSIRLQGVDPATNSLTGTYGVEFDRTKTGRGDLLFLVRNLTTEWSMQNVSAYSDPDKSVGGVKPILADPDFNSNGYEGRLQMSGDKVAFARIKPDNPLTVQIAINKGLLDFAQEFLWSCWADKGINDPGKFDYNDHFGLSESGSPVKTSKYYPLQAISSVDNTCRLPFGFTPNKKFPGICSSAAPVSSACQIVCLNPPGAGPGACDLWSTCP